MDLNENIDIYCERIGIGFWAEPLNAISNIAFMFAAIFAWKLYISHYKNNAKKDINIEISIALAFIVGIGSFLFHTFATLWSLWLDIIPIYLFVFYYIVTALKKIIKLNSWQATIGIILFVSLILLMGRLIPRETLNGSSEYFPFVVALALFGGILQYKKQPAAKYFWSATGIFCLALFFRIIDMVFCPYFSLGTHFLWHILNAIVIYLLLRVLILAQKTEREFDIKESRISN